MAIYETLLFYCSLLIAYRLVVWMDASQTTIGLMRFRSIHFLSQVAEDPTDLPTAVGFKREEKVQPLVEKVKKKCRDRMNGKKGMVVCGGSLKSGK